MIRRSSTCNQVGLLPCRSTSRRRLPASPSALTQTEQATCALAAQACAGSRSASSPPRTRRLRQPGARRRATPRAAWTRQAPGPSVSRTEGIIEPQRPPRRRSVRANRGWAAQARAAKRAEPAGHPREIVPNARSDGCSGLQPALPSRVHGPTRDRGRRRRRGDGVDIDLSHRPGHEGPVACGFARSATAPGAATTRACTSSLTRRCGRAVGPPAWVRHETSVQPIEPGPGGAGRAAVARSTPCAADTLRRHSGATRAHRRRRSGRTRGSWTELFATGAPRQK